MNYDITKEILSVRDLVYDGTKEVPIDLDFSLPDYCPDIQKILKCRVSPEIFSRNISGDRLNIEGSAKIRVLYINCDNNNIRSCENNIPFSCSIDIKNTPENYLDIISTKLEYVNCRAISPRKLDIHGAISIYVQIYNKNNLEISTKVNSDDIQQKKIDLDLNNLVSMGQQQFSINEVLELPENKPAPESIINSNINLIINNYKNMKNKTVIKGNLIIKILYIHDLSTGQTDNLEYTIPISQVIDVPGIDENTMCVINSSILSHEEIITSSNNSNLISCDIKIFAGVSGYIPKEISVISDVYSTDYNLDILNKNTKISYLIDKISENITKNFNISLGDSKVSKIIDIWTDNFTNNHIISDNNLNLKNKINICILYLDDQENPIYTERVVEFDYSKLINNNINKITNNLKFIPENINYNLSNNNSDIDLKIDFVILGEIYNNTNFNMITDIITDESKNIEKDNSSLIIYYANKDEKIWDIARKYHSSPEIIKNENNLSDDIILNNSMILIPVK
ncbi:MAG: DUF3794 domain-containing protein [Clostridia bacterium]|nr:DUF3794 domain-containing protein [Clostridia bacterium]